MKELERLENLIGQNNLKKLQKSKVAIFGIGGVGGYVCEALARSGIGEFLLVDFDTVSISNLNRQIIATYDSVGKPKVEVMKNRINSINKKAKVEVLDICVNSENIDMIDLSKYDFIVDAIDMVTSKLLIIQKAKQQNLEVISCMGTGNKLDATKLKIDDISKTSYCPLAKIMRKELKNRNLTKINVLFSQEECKNNQNIQIKDKSSVASIMYVPATAGLLIAQHVITKIMEK